MTTYTTTASGHKIEVRCWATDGFTWEIHIDGELFDEWVNLICVANTEYDEAYWQAHTTATDIKKGRIRRIDGKWRFIEDAEIERGNRLRDALDTTIRDEWLEGGLPERATEDSRWAFGGWNAVHDHLRVHGWVILGGDLYAVSLGRQDAPKATPETTEAPNVAALTLPPDPDGLNESRSGWASLALGAFQNVSGCEFQHLLPDLLDDLMHWCDRTGVSFEASLRMARVAYAEETATDELTDNKTEEKRDDI